VSEQLSRRTLIGGRHKYCKAAETCPAADEQIEIQSGQAIHANNKTEKTDKKIARKNSFFIRLRFRNVKIES
jgi:hypothetical protein